MCEALVEELRQRLSKRRRISVSKSYLRRAAVLIPIYQEEGECFLVFIRRSRSVNSHGGEISFPGGGVLETDRDSLSAALREAWEEVGIPPEEVKVVGVLDDAETVTSRYAITPYVGFLRKKPAMRPEPSEVEEIIEIPLRAFCEEASLHVEDWVIGDTWMPIYFYRVRGYVIWGATARILKNLLDVWGVSVRSD